MDRYKRHSRPPNGTFSLRKISSNLPNPNMNIKPFISGQNQTIEVFIRNINDIHQTDGAVWKGALAWGDLLWILPTDKHLLFTLNSCTFSQDSIILEEFKVGTHLNIMLIPLLKQPCHLTEVTLGLIKTSFSFKQMGNMFGERRDGGGELMIWHKRNYLI